MQWTHNALQARQIWRNERGSLLVEKAGLAMATAVLILGLAVMFTTRGGEIGQSLVQVFTCQLGRFGGGGGAGCGAPAATSPGGGGGGGGAPATNPGGGTQAGNPSGNPFANFSFWDWAQLALDLFGFIPGVGEIADFINAIISAIRGDWAGAALSLAAMWPAGGQAATIAKISAKYGDEVAAVFRNLDDIIAGRRSADEVAGGARRLPCVATGPSVIVAGVIVAPFLQSAVLAPASALDPCGAALQQRASELRQSLNVGRTRNIAVADISVEGLPAELVGVSGQASRAGTVDPPASRFFQTITTPDGNPRTLDAENKILEHIAQQLATQPGVYPEFRGTINLYTELPPCVSCSNVIEQFRRMFPNITVNVYQGS